VKFEPQGAFSKETTIAKKSLHKPLAMISQHRWIVSHTTTRNHLPYEHLAI